MSENKFKEIAGNVELMQMIFSYLNFNEQLKLAQVCDELKYIFANFVWRVNYEKIQIIKNPPNFHVVDADELNKLKLSATEFEYFLNIYSSEIKELNDKCETCLDIRKFPNLTSLSYSCMIIPKTQFQIVAQHCKKLEKLTICCCRNEEENVFTLGRDLEIKTLLEMKELKYLDMQGIREQLCLPYRNFLELVTKSQIKHLLLFYYIESEDEVDLSDRDTTNSLVELHINTTFEEQHYLMNYSSYLKFFENLIHLTLDRMDDIENNTIEVLGKTCKKLKILSIIYTSFKDVDNFNLLTTVEDFSLDVCDGLTHKNLKQILTEMPNLKKFACWVSNFEGEFENFTISSKLEALKIYDLNTHKLKGAYEENHNLKSLVWYNNFEGPTPPATAFNCPNLECLEIHYGYVPLELVMQLKSLVSLTIIWPDKHVNWSYVLPLIRDMDSLQEFKLNNNDKDLGKTNKPKEAFKCSPNLKSIDISIHVFDWTMDFWLDLLNKNPRLKLIVSCSFYQALIRDIISNPKFPRSLRVLHVNGVKVDLIDLEKNYNETLDKIIAVSMDPLYSYESKSEIIINLK
ncbi:uncharacterized protein ACRADG_003206 [Cochliomyia hominivorax]